jgi:hypothetical protein
MKGAGYSHFKKITQNPWNRAGAEAELQGRGQKPAEMVGRKAGSLYPDHEVKR